MLGMDQQRVLEKVQSSYLTSGFSPGATAAGVHNSRKRVINWRGAREESREGLENLTVRDSRSSIELPSQRAGLGGDLVTSLSTGMGTGYTRQGKAMPSQTAWCGPPHAPPPGPILPPVPFCGREAQAGRLGAAVCTRPLGLGPRHATHPPGAGIMLPAQRSGHTNGWKRD